MKAEDKEVAVELIKLLLEGAKLETMRRIYERVAPAPDGRVRTDLNIAGPETGRLSSRETWLEEGTTNYQNLPKKVAFLDSLYNVRTCLIPDPGKTLLEGDLKSAEAIATAAFAGDWRIVDLFLSGGDAYVDDASKILGKDPREVSKVERQLYGKFPRLSLGYGIGWKKFMQDINKDADITGISIDAKTAKFIHSEWHRLNPLVRRWWRKVEEEVRSRGYLVTPYGRKRIFIDKSGGAVNNMIAFLPQSTIADHLNFALVEVFEKLDPNPFEVQLQIHDAILGQCDSSAVMPTALKLKNLMTRSFRVGGREVEVPVEISASSKSWGDMKDLL